MPPLSAIDPIPAPVLPWDEEVKTNLSSTACRRSTALACVFGALVALTVPSHPVTLAQAPQGSLRLQKGHLVYAGAFRLPGGPTGTDFDGGGQAMSFNPANGTLQIGKAEVNIPAIRTGASLSDLATATVRSTRSLPNLDVFVCGEAKLFGGTLLWQGDLIVSGYCYYDGGSEPRSHWRVTSNGASGPLTVGSRGQGFVGGPMTPIPTEWRSLFGGPALTGLWAIPIISRTSAGPTASVFDPGDVGVKNPVPATPVVGYPLDHPTLGNDGDGTLFSITQQPGGIVFAPGTRSVLFFAGKKAKGPFCYGTGQVNPALHGTFNSAGTRLCYDPVNWDQGNHGYPYAHFVYAYDANDLVAVKKGQKQPWQVVPYATWAFDVPFQHAQRVIAGVAYDSETKRVFLTAANGDGDKPLVHVFTIDEAASVATPAGPGGGLRRAPLGASDTERRLAAPRFRGMDANERGEPGGEEGNERATTNQGSGTDAVPADSPATGMMRRRAVARAPMPAATDARRASPPRVAECPGTNPFANSEGRIGVCVNGVWTLVAGVRTGGVVRQRQGASGEEVWLIQTDEAVYEVAGALDSAYQTDGLQVVFEGRFPSDVPSGSTGAVVIEIRQINVVRHP